MSKLTLVPGGKNKPRQYANQTIILPLVGEVTFNAEGNLEIEATKALPLVEATKETMAFFVDKNSLPKKTPPPSDPPKLAVETPETTGKKDTNEGSAVTGGEGSEDQNSDGDTTNPELSAADQAALDQLSAASQEKQEIAKMLDELDLAGLTKLAKEFPDLTVEKLASMTDGKLRSTLLERLVK